MNALIADYVSKARHRITLAEARAMQAAGVFGDRDFELIDGELIDMGGDGGRSINWNAAIGRWLYDGLRERPDLVVVPDKTLALSDVDGPKPDFWVFPDAIANPEDVRGPDVLLAIEVSDRTLEKDLGPKAKLYETFGVREYWVIDCAARRVFAHRLGQTGYGVPLVAEAQDSLTAALIPGLTLRLDRLPRIG